MLSRWAYMLYIEEYAESFKQLSNELLQCSFACIANIKQLGMIKSFEGFLSTHPITNSFSTGILGCLLPY